jgi:hypothetical protein
MPADKQTTSCSTTARAPFRLALRVEGAFWNAYLAHSDTMANSTLLGSIRLAVVQDADRKTRFMALMQDALSAALMDASGIEMSWPEPPQSAPEHERSGSA